MFCYLETKNGKLPCPEDFPVARKSLYKVMTLNTPSINKKY